MAIVDLTKVDPYAENVEQQALLAAQRQENYQHLFDNVSRSIQAGVQRRDKLNADNREMRDREYALANKETGNLLQAETNNKFTDLQIQGLGRQFKQEYYQAYKTYENSDKSDEARQAFEQSKQRSLGSARVVSGSLEKLGAQMEMFRNAASLDAISDGTDPSVRQFMLDLQDDSVAQEHYQIVPDEETGSLRYVGRTTATEENPDGYEVSFLLDDIANGENLFVPLAKTSMPDLVMELTKNVSAMRQTEEREWGIVEVNNWKGMEDALTSNINKKLTDPNAFKSIAAGMGYGFNDIQTLKNGGAITTEDGVEISDISGLKDAMREELLMQIETIIPAERIVHDKRRSELLQKYKQDDVNQIALEKDTTIFSNITASFDGEDPQYFQTQLLGANVRGRGGLAEVSNVKFKDGKLQLFSGIGDDVKPLDVFDYSDPADMARLQGIMGGTRQLRNEKYQQDAVSF